MTEITKRSFFKLLMAAAVAPFIPKGGDEIIGEADFGFTWGNIRVADTSYMDAVTATLRARSKELADNVTKNNALLLRLENNKAIKLNRIDPAEQVRRISSRVGEKRARFDHALRTDQYNTVQKVKNSGNTFECYKYTEKVGHVAGDFYDGYSPLKLPKVV